MPIPIAFLLSPSLNTAKPLTNLPATATANNTKAIMRIGILPELNGLKTVISTAAPTITKKTGVTRSETGFNLSSIILA